MPWLIRQNGQEIGPLSTADLRLRISTGELPLDVPVFRDGMKDWKPASKVKGLMDGDTNEPVLSRRPSDEAAPADVPLQSTAPPTIPAWFYADASHERRGPFTTEQIQLLQKQHVIAVDTMVWKTGMPDWQPAGVVSEFQSAFGDTSAAVLSAIKEKAVVAAKTIHAVATSQNTKNAIGTLATQAKAAANMVHEVASDGAGRFSRNHSKILEVGTWACCAAGFSICMLLFLVSTAWSAPFLGLVFLFGIVARILQAEKHATRHYHEGRNNVLES